MKCNFELNGRLCTGAGNCSSNHKTHRSSKNCPNKRAGCWKTCNDQYSIETPLRPSSYYSTPGSMTAAVGDQLAETKINNDDEKYFLNVLLF